MWGFCGVGVFRVSLALRRMNFNPIKPGCCRVPLQPHDPDHIINKNLLRLTGN